MPVRTWHADLPSFDPALPTVTLPTISLSQLLRDDPASSSTIFDAARSLGIFAISLDDTSSSDPNRASSFGPALIQESENILKLAQKFMGSPRSEKDVYGHASAESVSLGYRYIEGKDVINDAGDKVRLWEGLAIPKDDLLGLSSNPITYPPTISSNFAVFKSFTSHCHTILTHVFTALETTLELSPGTLTSIHGIDRRSGDLIRFNHAPPARFSEEKAHQTEHTDFGSLTILFNWLGGFQVRVPVLSSSDSSEHQWVWRYVEPEPGRITVNLGDVMVKLSNGVLVAPVHRISPASGEQYGIKRDSLVYAMKPADGTVLKPLSEGLPLRSGTPVEEEEMTIEEWVERRANGDLTGIYTREGGVSKRGFELK